MTDLWNKLIKPMLAYPSDPFSKENWIFEIKFDGTRCIAYIDVENKKVRFLNRRFKFFEYRYPELSQIHSQINAKKVILDGEIVVLKNGKPDFFLLQEREQIENEQKINLLSKLHPATFVVFDILYLNGENLINYPLYKRKEILEKIIDESENLILTEYIEKEGEAFFEEVKKIGLEGIVAKKLDSIYQIGKRSKDWRKIKNLKTIDAIVCGFTEGKGKREGSIGALLLGAFHNKELIYIGRVGTGKNWNETFLKKLREMLEKIEIKEIPFKNFDEPPSIKEISHFVQPKYVCEIEFLEITKDLKLRAPSFVRLRFDKPLEDCTI